MTKEGPGASLFAENGEIRLAYEDFGPATGDPLILIMGVGASRFWWPAGLIRVLQEHGFHVVSFDLRDSGESTHLRLDGGVGPYRAMLRNRRSAYTAEDMTDDAVAVLDAIDMPRSHLFGMSFGGVVAQRVALRHPERVSSITTFASAPSDATVRTVLLRYIRLRTQCRLLPLMRRSRGPEDDAVTAMKLMRAIASPGYPFDEAAAHEAIAQDQARGISSFRDFAAQGRQTGATWRGGSLKDLRVPALVMCGDADRMLNPQASRDTAAAIPCARLVILPGVGHDLPRGIWPTMAQEIRANADRAG